MYVVSNGIKTAVVLRDPDPSNPRDPDYQENLTKMVCWHGRYNLGDKHDFKTPYDFAVNMANKHLNQKDVLSAIKNGELSGFRMSDTAKENEYAVDVLVGMIPGKEHWERADWKVTKDLDVLDGEMPFDMEDCIYTWCNAQEMLQLCQKYGDIAIMPLYLYDHSGISISTSSFVGRAHHADWDSGQIGYIFLDKDTAMKELAMPGDKLRLSMPVPYPETLQIHRNSADSLDAIMTENSYKAVRYEDILNMDAPKDQSNPSQPMILPEWAEDGRLFKKDNTLYRFDHFNPDDTIDIEPVAYFNPDILPLTEETWRARAEDIIRADVTEYDNYLTGEVYGYQTFEGLDEVDSCWGFNPGSENIEALMDLELSGWYGAKMKFEQLYEDEFNIDAFFCNQEFPELKAKILKDVKEFIASGVGTSQVYPFAMSAEDILSNVDSSLDNIVEDLYGRHEAYDTNAIFSAVMEHAGASRSVLPKLSAADLDPNRDYTAEEIMEVFSKKPSLNDIIANAVNRSGSLGSEQTGKNLDQQRS